MRSFHAIGLLLLLAGCVEDYARPGTWQPRGANEANLRSMLANPADAARGTAAVDDRGQPGSLAAQRLQRGQRPLLPEMRLSRIGVATGGAAGSGNAR